MGEIISIREQIRPYEFRIGFTDGEERVVSVDPDKKGLFRDQQPQEKKSIACPFLREQATHRRICTVHASRPGICRGYLCSRILILDIYGNRVGRVPYGTRSFTTTNEALLGIWNSTLRDVVEPDNEQWEKNVDDTFARAGYRVIR
jgi:hypothetical protein